MTTTSKRRARPLSQSASTSNAAGLSFSIEKILGKPTSDKEYVARSDDSCKDCVPIPAPENRAVKSPPAIPFPWLSYTRYCPPKIPRSKRRQKQRKRKSSGTPRVPFSTNQILKLEKKYSQGRYLSPSEVVKISEDLDLAQHRIKIWFQNRRAREKRTENEN